MKTVAPALPAPAHAPAQTKAKSQADNRLAATAQRQVLAAIDNSPRQAAQRQQAAPVQRKPNATGLPDNLKAGVENLSGHSLDDVQVHYNSSKPSQLQAHAYAQGTDIHLAPGQEKHLPHEAWHVAQQKQGRVRPTRQLKGVSVNDDSALEREADVRGQQALQLKAAPGPVPQRPAATLSPVVQRNSFEDFNTYAQAKNANAYSKKLLDTQKGDKIGSHLKKAFSGPQQAEIYKVNMAGDPDGDITSDEDGTVLHKQDIDTTPHIDHRYPKSQNGSNSPTNAQVLPAGANISKGANRGELSAEPAKALLPYRSLAGTGAFAPAKLGRGREFSGEQRAAILAANEAYYGKNSVVSDGDKKTELSRYDTTQVPHIDHIMAKGEGGTNYYFNAKVLPASENLQKSGKRGLEIDIDAEISEMTLPQYYRAKTKARNASSTTKGTKRDRDTFKSSALEDLNAVDSEEESEVESDSERPSARKKSRTEVTTELPRRVVKPKSKGKGKDKGKGKGRGKGKTSRR